MVSVPSKLLIAKELVISDDALLCEDATVALLDEDELDSDEKVNDEKCELASGDCELIGLENARLENALLEIEEDELGVGVGDMVVPPPPPPHAVSTSKKPVHIKLFNEKASFLPVKKNSMSSPK